MLISIPQVLAPGRAQQCRELLAQAPWLDGASSAGGQAAAVKANLQLDQRCELATTLRREVLAALSVHPLFISAALPAKIFPPRFNCYQDGGHYGPHIDNAILQLEAGGFLRSDLAATLFLCDADSYHGGELIIESQYGPQAIKLNSGDLILYPATSLHEVNPVTRGQRISGFFWVQSMVACARQREQLFELDQCIQALSSQLGAAASEVRRLSGIYHNLLREWGQV